MTFQPRMTSSIEGITILEDLRWRRWNGVVADVWHVHCAAGARGEYISHDARLFVVLDQSETGTQVRLTGPDTNLSASRAPRHMSFVPAGMPLWSRIEKPGQLRHLDLHFDIDTLSRRLGEDLDENVLSTPRLDFTDNRIHGLARLIAQECMEPDSRHDLYGDGLMLALFIDLMKLGPTPSARRSALSPRQLKRVQGFIEDNCMRNIRMQELAELTELSQSYFSHAFKAATGLPPHQWHMKVRMKRVQDMLTREELSLADIAASAGFADQAHFTRAFRRACGITPAAWRRTHRG